MFKILVQGLIIILLWIGGWNLAEAFVDTIAGDDKGVRNAVYVCMLLLGFLLLWIVETAIPG